jgi:hypothetical protein
MLRKHPVLCPMICFAAASLTRGGSVTGNASHDERSVTLALLDRIKKGTLCFIKK